MCARSRRFASARSVRSGVPRRGIVLRVLVGEGTHFSDVLPQPFRGLHLDGALGTTHAAGFREPDGLWSSTRQLAKWSPGKTQKMSGPDEQARALLRRLLYGRRAEYPRLVTQVREEIAELGGVSLQLQSQLETAVRHAHQWLEEQNETRRALLHAWTRQWLISES